MNKGKKTYNIDISILTNILVVDGLSPTPTTKVGTILSGDVVMLAGILDGIELVGKENDEMTLIRGLLDNGIKQMLDHTKHDTYEFSYETSGKYFKLSMHRFFTPLQGNS